MPVTIPDSLASHTLRREGKGVACEIQYVCGDVWRVGVLPSWGRRRSPSTLWGEVGAWESTTPGKYAAKLNATAGKEGRATSLPSLHPQGGVWGASEGISSGCVQGVRNTRRGRKLCIPWQDHICPWEIQRTLTINKARSLQWYLGALVSHDSRNQANYDG